MACVAPGLGRPVHDGEQMGQHVCPQDDRLRTLRRDITDERITAQRAAGGQPCRIRALHPQAVADNPARLCAGRHRLVLDGLAGLQGGDIPEAAGFDQMARVHALTWRMLGGRSVLLQQMHRRSVAWFAPLSGRRVWRPTGAAWPG